MNKTQGLAELVAEWRRRVKAIGRDTGSYAQCADELEAALSQQPAVATDAQVEAFARVWWADGWPFKPDNAANRELAAEFRVAIAKALTAALHPGAQHEQ